MRPKLLKKAALALLLIIIVSVIGAYLAFTFSELGGAKIAYNYGNYGRAIDSTTKVIDDDKSPKRKRLSALTLRGKTWFAQKSYQEAIDDFSHAIEIGEELISSFQRVTKQDVLELIDAYNGRAGVYIAKKDFETCLKDQKRAMQLLQTLKK